MNKKAGKNSQPIIVGIDLGTTNSAAAVLEQRQPVLIPHPDGSRLLPSVVHRTVDGDIIVGKDAEAAKVAMPAHTIAAAKRHLGSDIELRLGTKTLRAEEALALVLSELKTWVQSYLQLEEETPIEAVITVPAYFAEAQRRAVQRAGQLAGFIVERMINEPTAASLAYGLGRKDDNGLLLVYDLGGGTFDVSLVEMYDGILEVRASHGNGRLGGEDFDWLIAEHLAAVVKAETGADPMGDLQAKALLKQQAEAAKKELSERDAVDVAVPLLMFHGGKPVSVSASLQRSQFETMIHKHIAETMKSVETVLREANVQPAEVKDILLVGGSTRIPLVRQAIKDVFGREPLAGVDPDEAVALGAAVQAGIKSGAITVDTLLATDVAPFSLGIETVMPTGDGFSPGWFSRIIRRNTTIPVRATETYTTLEYGQTAVDILVYQGEGDKVKDNFLLGKFRFEDIPFNPHEIEKFDVTFTYNLNGLLDVEAAAAATGKNMNVTIHDRLERSSRRAFKDSIKRLEDLKVKQTYEPQPLPLDLDDWGPLPPDTDESAASMKEEMNRWLETLNDEPMTEEDSHQLSGLAQTLIGAITAFIDLKGSRLPAEVRRKMKRYRTALRRAVNSKDHRRITEALSNLSTLMEEMDKASLGDEEL